MTRTRRGSVKVSPSSPWGLSRSEGNAARYYMRSYSPFLPLAPRDSRKPRNKVDRRYLLILCVPNGRKLWCTHSPLCARGRHTQRWFARLLRNRVDGIFLTRVPRLMIKKKEEKDYLVSLTEDGSGICSLNWRTNKNCVLLSLTCKVDRM